MRTWRILHVRLLFNWSLDRCLNLKKMLKVAVMIIDFKKNRKLALCLAKYDNSKHIHA